VTPRRILVLAIALVVIQDACACRRDPLPPDLALALADVVVEARVDHVDASGLTVTPRKIHKGAMAKKQAQVLGNFDREYMACYGAFLEKGDTYLFLLSDRLPGETAFRVIDSLDGVLSLSAAKHVLQTRLVATPWARRADGLWLKAVLGKETFAANEEFNVALFFRNATTTGRTLKFRSWPSTDRTACAMQGAGIAGMPVPIAKTEIDDFFARVGPKFDIDLGAGEIFRWGLAKVTTAVPGYGYKEWLDFQYYPLQPGRYEASIVCRGFGKELLRADGLRFSIKASGGPG
jgi:hypothetical protein